MTPRQTVGHDANDRRNPLAELFALLLLTSAVVVVVLVVASGFSGA
ncbi:hypothetical protein HQ325_13435 [Rhodococcus sp. BP-349]|nr:MULTISPECIES: hypothetical protein [unclassified Rhodococcus (in: high G+C Gram-positive bacteria)]MBY6539678.1 hypothetical protein [Rhodococcus sp. BP-363]MBY6543994.1 hypothetical protein [Rhodococcus sp. BP-369]MBY6563224.1 hypothetical protein [Rhodococcus sp. BP-370]MBY6577516.1 hypothetical protein [Rhodococcus sp. BP-364]MBY6586817.1 hypothetical protein [Rhodococcus sp. BP-358]